MGPAILCVWLPRELSHELHRQRAGQAPSAALQRADRIVVMR
jgi:hypothetical protein